MGLLSLVKKAKNKFGAIIPVGYGPNGAQYPNVDYHFLQKGYKGDIYIAASKNASTCASIPLRLYVAKQSSKKALVKTKPVHKDVMNYLDSNPRFSKMIRKAVDVEEVLEHPFYDLMQNVNSFTNQFDLMELTILGQELVGNAYWYVVRNETLGIPQEIYVLPPARVSVIPDKNKNGIAGYIYEQGVDKVYFESDMIVHFKYPNPNDLFYGLSPLESQIETYHTQNAMNKYEFALFKNEGRIPGAFTTDSPLSEVQFERLGTQLKEMYAGISNAGKIPLLESGLKFDQWAIPPKDLSFLEGRKVTREQIFNAFGQSVGMWDKDSTRANSENAEYMYTKQTILPRLRRVEEKLNEKLAPMYDETIFVAFDNPVPKDKEYRLKERESNLRMYYSSINQEREKDGQPPVEWGDTPWGSFSDVPLGTPSPMLERGVDKAEIVKQLTEAIKVKKKPLSEQKKSGAHI